MEKSKYTFVLAGRVGVGKSSIFYRLSRDEFLASDRAKQSIVTTGYNDGVEKYDYQTKVDGRPVQVGLGAKGTFSVAE